MLKKRGGCGAGIAQVLLPLIQVDLVKLLLDKLDRKIDPNGQRLTKDDLRELFETNRDLVTQLVR
jgi:hypothetical protein